MAWKWHSFNKTNEELVVVVVTGSTGMPLGGICIYENYWCPGGGELHGTECQSVDFVDYDEDLGSDAVIEKRQLASLFEDTP